MVEAPTWKEVADFLSEEAWQGRFSVQQDNGDPVWGRDLYVEIGRVLAPWLAARLSPPATEESTGGHEHEWAVVCLGCDAHPNVADHFVTFDAEGWSVEHSLACRMSGDMVGCAYHAAVRSVADVPHVDRMGRWRITGIDDEGLPSLERSPWSPR